jgi:DNA-binding response OmpR family regulator
MGGMEGEGGMITAGILTLDPITGRLTREGMDGEGRLQSQPAQFLAYLMKHAGRMVTRNDAYRALYRDMMKSPHDHILDVYLRTIRQQLAALGCAPLLIQTIRGVGWRYNTNDNLHTLRFTDEQRAALERLIAMGGDDAMLVRQAIQ